MVNAIRSVSIVAAVALVFALTVAATETLAGVNDPAKVKPDKDFMNPVFSKPEGERQVNYEKVRQEFFKAQKGDLVETYHGVLALVRINYGNGFIHIFVIGADSNDLVYVDDVAAIVSRIIKKTDPEYKELAVKFLSQ